MVRLNKMVMNWRMRRLSDAAEWKANWDSLNERIARLPMQDFEFWKALLRDFGSGNELVCLCLADDEMIAATIVDAVGKGRWESVAPPQAPMGAWMSAGTVPLDRLLAALASALPGTAVSVGLTRLDPDFEKRPSESSTVTVLDYVATGRVSCSDGFDAYWERRGRNLRQNMKRQRNRLGRRQIVPVLKRIEDPIRTAASVDRYGQLESRGWKGQSGTALHPDNTQGRFYRGLFEHYSARGESAIYEYYFDNELVAMDMCLRRGSTLTILKTTHDEQQRDTSPALLMRQETFRKMLDEDGIERIEFYGKQMDWHTKWTEDFRKMYHVNFDRFRVFRWLRSIRNRGGAAALGTVE